MKKTILFSVSAFLAFICCESSLWAEGTEDFGNKPLQGSSNQYPDLISIINHENRVYHTWVNGNEQFYYQSEISELNQVLQTYAKSNLKKHKVIVKSGPGSVNSMLKTQKIRFNWNLQVLSGIALTFEKKITEFQKQDIYPVLTIYLSEEITLEKLNIPKGVTVIKRETKKRE